MRVDKQVIGKRVMKYFNLMPSGGWTTFTRNAELADLIYEVGFDDINEGGWFHINPMSNTGIFEDENGNYMCLVTRDERDLNLIIEMHAGLIGDTPSSMSVFIKEIENDFGLMRTERRV